MIVNFSLRNSYSAFGEWHTNWSRNARVGFEWNNCYWNEVCVCAVSFFSSISLSEFGVWFMHSDMMTFESSESKSEEWNESDIVGRTKYDEDWADAKNSSTFDLISIFFVSVFGSRVFQRLRRKQWIKYSPFVQLQFKFENSYSMEAISVTRYCLSPSIFICPSTVDNVDSSLHHDDSRYQKTKKKRSNVCCASCVRDSSNQQISN